MDPENSSSASTAGLGGGRADNLLMVRMGIEKDTSVVSF